MMNSLPNRMSWAIKMVEKWLETSFLEYLDIFLMFKVIDLYKGCFNLLNFNSSYNDKVP